MTCQMMQMTQRLQHRTISDVEILRLPYGDDSNFVAHVLMPPMGYEKDEFDNIKKATDLVFDPKAWNLAMDSLVYEKFKLRMPKFKIECNESLNTPLYMLGMENAFGRDENMPSFERLTDTNNVYVKSVKQAIKLEVNEVGTKMVSSDAVELSFRGRDPYDTIEVNRRFLFVVSHLPTGAIMLASIVYTPEYK
jgi:serine protease inhibitor